MRERPVSSTIRFKDRSCLNKTLRALYLEEKTIYVAYWFYWAGYIVTIASYVYLFVDGA